MSNPAHRALRIILGIFSPAAAGLLFFLRAARHAPLSSPSRN
jgi:hypothetical protein